MASTCLSLSSPIPIRNAIRGWAKLRSIRCLLGALLLVAWSISTPVCRSAVDPAWTTVVTPFRIVGNLYYVGSQDLAAYLVVTPAGNILINSNLATSPPQIKASIEKLGFRASDTKILLISHGHFDHAAGSARMKQMTGAEYMVMDDDVPLVESGGRSDFALGREAQYQFAPTRVDRVLHDGDEVRLGGSVLVAHKTAGHTRGCTTWTMKVSQDGRIYDVVIIGSTSVLDSYRLAGRESYPGIAADYRKTFVTLKALPCDVFLASHGSMFGLKQKLASEHPQAFVDPAGYHRFVEESEREFEAVLTKQQALLPKN